MTPQDKAKELVGKYYVTIYHTINQQQKAKECALISVDEILEDNRINYMLLGVGIGKYYWQEVKKEIEAL